MKTFDELLAMSEQERGEYLRSEVESVIVSAPENQRLKLRALQARINNVAKHRKDPIASSSAIYGMMLDSLFDLRDALERMLEKPL